MKHIVLFFCTALFITGIIAGQQPVQNSWEETPVALINEIYKTVSAKAGDTVNWVKVRSMFVDEALVILRTAPQVTKQFTADGFIQDFKDFYQYAEVKANGFEEKILNMKAMIYKDMAFIVTIYEAAIPGSARPPQKGIDFWLLIKKDSRWKIFSVTNEVVPKGQELPDEKEWKF